MHVKELRERLEEIESEHPDADVQIDPPGHGVLGVYYRDSRDVVELTH